MALTQEQQAIFDAILSSLQTNSKTIEQLTPQTSLGANDWFELNGGRKVSYTVLRDLITSITDQDSLKALISKNVLKSVSFDVTGSAATLTIKSEGTTISCNAPVVTTQKAGIISVTDYLKLKAADSRAAPLPITRVENIPENGIELPNANSLDDIMQYMQAQEASDVSVQVVTDGSALQLQVRVTGDSNLYYAYDWGDIPEKGIPSHERYYADAAVFVDRSSYSNERLYIWSDDQSEMTAIANENDIYGITSKIGAAGGIAPLGADGKVPAANLPDNDATLRFLAVERVPGATITQGTATGTFYVVWLDNRALATSHPYTAPTAEEKEVQGRFVAKTGSGIQLTEASGGDVSTTTYYANWAGRDTFCNSAGKPLKNRLYLCTSTGRQYDKFPGNNSTGLRCIAAPPMDAKKALFADLWNEACVGSLGWGADPDYSPNHVCYGYYDADMDAYRLNGLDLTYAEAVRVYYAGPLRNTFFKSFYGGFPFIRTNLPPHVIASDSLELNSTFSGCSCLEVANIKAGLWASGGNIFHANNKLRKVIGEFVLDTGSMSNLAPYTTIPLLEDMHIRWRGGGSTQPLNIANLPAFNAASLEWMITNSPALTDESKTRTCTLHADAYARLTDDMKALAAEKSITFVCAS